MGQESLVGRRLPCPHLFELLEHQVFYQSSPGPQIQPLPLLPIHAQTVAISLPVELQSGQIHRRADLPENERKPLEQITVRDAGVERKRGNGQHLSRRVSLFSQFYEISCQSVRPNFSTDIQGIVVRCLRGGAPGFMASSPCPI